MPGNKFTPTNAVDQEQIPVPSNRGSNLIPNAWTLDNHQYLMNQVVAADRMPKNHYMAFFGNTNGFRWDQGRVITRMRPNWLGRPITHMIQYTQTIDASASTALMEVFLETAPEEHRKLAPKNILEYLRKYKYWKVTQAAYHFKVRHAGGWKGDQVQPVSLITYRHQNNANAAINTTGMANTANSATSIDSRIQARFGYGYYNWRNWYICQQDPRFQQVNGGQTLAPIQNYTFGTEDASLLHNYTSEMEFGYVWHESDITTDDPASVDVDRFWTVTTELNGNVAQPPARQEIYLIAVNEAQPWGNSVADILSCILDIRVRMVQTVQFRDPQSQQYFTTIDILTGTNELTGETEILGMANMDPQYALTDENEKELKKKKELIISSPEATQRESDIS